ncbi:MAG: hypothetical protein H7Y42_06090 [Chitinophagaceae bacterium]|nr:hypothetical protein [Chitinophagaceae bacterium]
MRSLFITILFCAYASILSAQIPDSLDNLVYKVNAGWKYLPNETYRQFTFTGKGNSFCVVTIYQARPSSGNKNVDFNSEWTERVENNFTVFTLAAPKQLKSKSGSTFQRLGAKAVDKQGNNFYVQLNVFDCNTAIQSVLVISATQKQLQQYDSSWQGLITRVKKDRIAPNPPSVSTSAATSSTGSTARSAINGSWHKSSSSPSAYTNGVLTNLAYSGYTKGEYNFNNDGTYTFQGESWSGNFNSNEYRLLDEKGTFTLSGNQLSVVPTNALYREVDRDGKLKRSEKLSLAKRTYTWKTHYYEGLNETALVLAAGKENQIDGGFSSSEAFPKSFIYSPGKKLEFRFLPYKP